MKQQCYVSSIWLSWLAAVALALVIGLRKGWLTAGVVLVVLLAAQLAYLRWFPRISVLLG